MGIILTCDGCFKKFEATSKEDTLPDEEGYVLCPQCRQNQNNPDNPYFDEFHINLLESVILGIAPWVGVKPPNNSQFTKEYNKKWKAFARVLRMIKKERGL